MADLDALRAKYPHLAFAVYAFDPAGPVTLECITADGKTFQFHGPTLETAIAAGFAEEPEPDPAPAPPAPPAPPALAPDTSVFD